jgi:hypothetical protein
MRALVLAVLANLLPGQLVASGAAADTHPADALRSMVGARLEAIPPTQTYGRYRLTAALEPRASQAPVEAVGFVLAAMLVPKSSSICFGPGYVFGDGFESDGR